MALPKERDAALVWRSFVIARWRCGGGAADIRNEAHRLGMPMTRADILNIIRAYVDRFDRDARQSCPRCKGDDSWTSS